jgi:hypothetical protein
VERLWLTAASVPERRTSLAHWRILLDADFEQAKRWLTPTQEIASAVPCQVDRNRWLRVAEDEPFRYLSYDENSHSSRAIDRAEVTVFGIDWSRVAESLCGQTGFHRSATSVSIKPAWHWGTAHPQMGFAFPLFLASGPLIDTLTSIGDQTNQPFVVLRLRNKPIDSLCGRLLNEHCGLLLSLAEVTQPTDSGEIAFTQPALERIASFQQQFLPKQLARVAKPGFPTPPNCSWSAIKIRFLDIDTVSITTAGVVGRYHFTEMGFSRSGNKRSNVQWELLRAFAKSYGTMTWTSPGASRRNQKRKERLSETLCEFFGISDDPIRWMPDRCGWQTLFALDPEP